MAAASMGPNSPEMPTKGKASCHWMLNNLWATCDIENTAGTGKQAMKWMGRWTFGYDYPQKAYRGAMVDNMGRLTLFNGTLEGSKLIWESVGEMKIPNMPSKMRITLDASDPKELKLTDEGYMNGKWTVRGTAVHKPVSAK
jgi:hypothetical protein